MFAIVLLATAITQPILMTHPIERCGPELCYSMWVARIRVTEKGTVETAELLKANAVQYGVHYNEAEIFAKAKRCVIPAIMKYKFRPAMKDGKPVAAWTTMSQSAKCR